MFYQYILSCLLGISACFVTGTVGIINGIEAVANQFPYQVIVQINPGLCGGGIIDDQFILTAAHCVFKDGNIKTKNISILAGMIDYRENGVRRTVKKIFVPKEYKPRDRVTDDDIAVLMLRGPFGLSSPHSTLKKLKLPENQHSSYIGKKAEVAGWGWNWIRQVNDGGRSDSRLRYAEAEVTHEFHNGIVKGLLGKKSDEKHIAVQLINKDDLSRPMSLCRGDSGGPLVHRETVIGIVSTAPYDCVEYRTISTYTRVAYYVQFINDVIRNKHNNNIVSVEVH